MVRSAGETGQLYGSVSTRDIADLLTAEGFTVARTQVELNQPIKAIGLVNIAIALHPEVEVTITLNIARSADEAERQAKGEMLTTAEAIYGDDINENARPENFFDPNEGDRRKPRRRSRRRLISVRNQQCWTKARAATPGLFCARRNFSTAVNLEQNSEGCVTDRRVCHEHPVAARDPEDRPDRQSEDHRAERHHP